MKKNKNKISSDKIIKIALAITAIIFAFIIYKIFDNTVLQNERIDLSKDSYYQYFDGIKQEYSGKMNIFEKNNQTQLVLENGNIIYLDSTPFYYKNTLGKVLFAKEMELIIPDIKNYKLDKFTNIFEQDKKMNIKKVNRKQTKTVENYSFLFDGADLYFFLDKMTVKIGKNIYELSPLSYVIVNYRQSVEMYDYEKDEFITIEDEEDLKQDVIATNVAKNYNINLSVDSLSTEKSDQLLISNFSNLTEFK